MQNSVSGMRAHPPSPIAVRSSSNQATRKRSKTSVFSAGRSDSPALQTTQPPVLPAALSAGVWGLIIGLGLWAILLPFAAIFALPSIPRGSLHIVCTLGIIAIITAGTALLIRNSVLKHASELAVTLPDSVTAHSAPTLGTPPIISLPAGSEIQVLSTRGDWVYAQISDDLRGWIPGESTAPLWPYDPTLIP